MTILEWGFIISVVLYFAVMPVVYPKFIRSREEKELDWRRADIEDMKKVKENIAAMEEIERIEDEMFNEPTPRRQIYPEHIIDTAEGFRKLSEAVAKTGISMADLTDGPYIEPTKDDEFRVMGRRAFPEHHFYGDPIYLPNGNSSAQERHVEYIIDTMPHEERKLYTAYRVQAGDTIASIAMKHKMTVSDLRRINKNIAPNGVHVNSLIIVYRRS